MLKSIPNTTATKVCEPDGSYKDCLIIWNPTGSGTTFYISQRADVGVEGIPLADGEKIALPRIFNMDSLPNVALYAYQASGAPVNIGYEYLR